MTPRCWVCSVRDSSSPSLRFLILYKGFKRELLKSQQESVGSFSGMFSCCSSCLLIFFFVSCFCWELRVHFIVCVWIVHCYVVDWFSWKNEMMFGLGVWDFSNCFEKWDLEWSSWKKSSILCGFWGKWIGFQLGFRAFCVVFEENDFFFFGLI